MHIRKITAAILAALLMISNGFPVSALEAQALPEKSAVLDEVSLQEPTSDTEQKSDVTISENDNNTEDNSSLDNKTDNTEHNNNSSDDDTNNTESNNNDDNANTDSDDQPDIPASDEAPAFYTKIAYSFEGYIVKGTFTEFAPDTTFVEPLYSLDGESYQTCGEHWDLHNLGTEDENILAKLQNQICLYSNCEPLKSYLAGKLDRFYLKLSITRENGMTYETQPAVIDRGIPQPLPEELSAGAMFSPDMAVLELRPFSYYGRYQITVSERSTSEKISAYLPDTLPIKIDLQTGKNHFADGIVDCPVTWKPLSLPQLTAGESVTIADAAEEIVVPAGTQVTTPVGTFRLGEPIYVAQYAPADEVRLVLNVISEDENPTGVLSKENNGLEMSFQLKPTGATSIQAYTLSEGDSEWEEIPNLSLLETVNAKPSTQNSDYALLLDNTLEPYRSYLEAQETESTPTPFFIGMKIEGGVYDGKQLILPWPGTYELPPKLPAIGGSGGNHNNAGSDNNNDSTESGQRPNLPQASDNTTQITTPPEEPKNDTDSESRDDDPTNEQHPNIPPNQENKPEATVKPDDTGENTGSGNNNTAEEQQPGLPQNPENRNRQWSDIPQSPNNNKEMPIKLSKSDSPSDYKTFSHQRSANTDLRMILFSEFSTTAQAQAVINTENSSPNTQESRKVQANISGEQTTPDSPQMKNKSADSLFSSNEKKESDRWEIPDRATAEGQRGLSLLSAVIIIASTLGIAGIYFAASSGKIAGKIRARLK